MKINVPTPAIVAVAAVLVLFIGVLFLKGAGGETAAPKPDPARFLPKGVSPMKTP
jgi:hypothetical protein